MSGGRYFIEDPLGRQHVSDFPFDDVGSVRVAMLQWLYRDPRKPVVATELPDDEPVTEIDIPITFEEPKPYRRTIRQWLADLIFRLACWLWGDK